MTAPAVRPLRKKTPFGALYTRTKEVEGVLLELLFLPDDAVVARCEIPSKDLIGYVPSECLVYLVRTRFGSSNQVQESIFGILAERVRQRLPRRTASDGAAISLSRSNIADEVFNQFVTMLMADRAKYDERLDALETCFDKIIKLRRVDATRGALRRHERYPVLDMDDSTGEVSKDLQDQGGSVQTNGLREIERLARRIDIDAAMDQLPALQRQILHLALRGLPRYSEDPSTLCIAKALGKSDKTIRTHLDLAITTVISILSGEKTK
ncbi:MAG: sigma-70 family RNA polymerase sigma factor [Opitutaceae bacterium]|nr:sigma-70 family RNA polymerase sigma factor [Opitutaceae bacterium]